MPSKRRKNNKKNKNNKRKRKKVINKKRSAPITASNLHKFTKSKANHESSKDAIKHMHVIGSHGGLLVSDPSLISHSERINLDPDHPFGEHMTLTTLNIGGFNNNASRPAPNPIEEEKQRQDHQAFMEKLKQESLQKQKQNRSSQHSDLNHLTDNIDPFWRLFSYKYRTNTSGQCNYYFIRGNYLDKVATQQMQNNKKLKCKQEGVNSWDLLEGLSLKDFQILIEKNIPNALNECVELKNLFDNGQFGDAVDVDGYRGHGLYILGFGDLKMETIQNAYERNTEKDFLKLIKTFDYNADHWYSLPMEVGDAPYNYYANTPLRDNDFRWIDPLRIAHKGVMWKICMMEMDKYKTKHAKNDMQFANQHLFIKYNGYDGYDCEWEKREMVKGYDEMAGINTYCSRYDDAVCIRLKRIQTFLKTLCPLGDVVMHELISFLL